MGFRGFFARFGAALAELGRKRQFDALSTSPAYQAARQLETALDELQASRATAAGKGR